MSGWFGSRRSASSQPCKRTALRVSPKGTTSVWDDTHLVFLDLCSPGTIANLTSNPNVEVNVIDPLPSVRATDLQGDERRATGNVILDVHD